MARKKTIHVHEMTLPLWEAFRKIMERRVDKPGRLTDSDLLHFSLDAGVSLYGEPEDASDPSTPQVVKEPIEYANFADELGELKKQLDAVKKSLASIINKRRGDDG